LQTTAHHVQASDLPGGTIKFDLFENTWVVGQETQLGFKKKKVRLSAIIDNLEEIAEARPLFPHEILLKINLMRK
jgi:hypothetical protein